MKELLSQYATYNIWANNEMLKQILLLKKEQQQQEIVSSFSSIYKTVFHLWDAESIWWQRLKLQEQITRPSDTKDISMQEVANGWQQQSKLWNGWVNKASDAQIDHVFAYQNTKKEQFKQPVFQMLLHLFNHGTYHRGQLVIMLRQLGVGKIAATDFVHWARSKK